MVNRCFECHGPGDKIKGGLRLTSRAAILAGGETGPAAEPGKPAASLLIEAVKYQGLEMPPKAKLPAEDIDKLARWVELGLPWPAGDTADRPAEPRGQRVHDQRCPARPLVVPEPCGK